MDQEWAVDAEDVLWRRTKLGLKLNADSVTALEAYMQERRSVRPPHSRNDDIGLLGR